ncbi:FCS-Like Zinc finger 8 [Ricinus communis]|uniref:FCS-Like Zinc finger 8 n=1 Tax=Ricinus communis TaxID=3988 RepID=UPI00201A90A9|nr:FCS-Like Zinc finger 8 [Ricinus communis]XP_015573535.2 FCS-Like Zinc finger 8 [Ricinus communis]
MIRKRSRVSSSKQVLMADYSSILSPTEKYRKPTSFPRLFTGFSFKNFSETTESVMSPTSILDSKPFSGFRNPFLPDQNLTPKTQESDTKRTWDKLDSKGIGLAIVDALNYDDKTDSNLSKPESRMVLFGSQLKIQVPPLPVSPTDQSPKSPADFGIKTRHSQLGSSSSGLSHSPVKKSVCGSANSSIDTSSSPGVFNGSLSAIEMEQSEDYTCVISYGPNPKTTHIFDDYIVESCCDVVEFSTSRTQTNGFLGDGSSYPSDNFLSFCYACKKNLGQGKDIYMYRGEKAFCSSECRYQEMLSEERIDKLDHEDGYGTCSQ